MKRKTELNPLNRRSRTRGALPFLFGAALALLPIDTVSRADGVRGEPINPAPQTPSPGTNAASSAQPSAPASSDAKKSGPQDAGFDRLAAFPFKTTDDVILGMGDTLSISLEISKQIPDSVKALSGKEISISGFMMPMKMHEKKAIEFLLLKNQGMCCYGKSPAMNEYVIVRMSGGITPVMDQLVTVTGTLRVGEMRQNRMLVGIYQLDADKAEVHTAP